MHRWFQLVSTSLGPTVSSTVELTKTDETVSLVRVPKV